MQEKKLTVPLSRAILKCGFDVKMKNYLGSGTIVKKTN